MLGYDLYEKKNKTLVDKVIKAVEAGFPVVSKDGRTKVEATNVRVKYDGTLPGLNSHQAARQSEGSITVPVIADIKLYRDDAKVQSLNNFKLGELPILTQLGTFMVNGGDYFTPNQLRLKPGAYTREMANGQLETFINLKGRPCRIWMEPDKGVLKFGYGSTNVDLVPILSAIGIRDSEIVAAFGGGKKGQELFEKNKARDNNTHVEKLLRAILERKQNRDLVRAGLVDVESPVDNMGLDERVNALRDWLSNQKLDAFVSKRTLGEPLTSLTPHTILTAATKLLKVARKEVEPDDRDSLEFKTMHSVEDMLPERIANTFKLLGRKLLSRLSKGDATIARGFGKNWLNPATMGYFGVSAEVEGGLAHTAEAANPLAILSEQTKTTLMGEGGIGEERAVSNSARLFRPGSAGFIDPVRSAEGSNIGITTYLATNAGKNDTNNLTTKMYKVENGKITGLVDVTVEEANDSVVAYPETWELEIGGKAKDSKVRANKDGDIQNVKASEVKYVIPSGRAMLDYTSNAALFFHHTHPNRGMMAGKHITQALPLAYREPPLSDIKDAEGKSVLETLASPFVVRSDVAGEVTKVSKTEIVVKDKDGKSHKFEIFNSYPMQAKVAIEHIPVVKVGDKVKKGDLLADTNYSKDGKIALGVNVRTAYTPWKNASNFEDAIAISESAAKKFSSLHVHRSYLDLEDSSVIVNKTLTHAQFPTAFTAESYKNIGDDGVVKEGVTVKPGDVLIAAVRKLSYDERDRSSKNLGSIHKLLERPYSNASVTWDEDFPGIVERITRTPKSLEVHLKTIEPAGVGDKLSMSSAAKGTIAAVIPDDKMPRDAKGRHMEVILNPHGVAGRINPSQTIEQAAGKLVRDHGVKYDHALFDGVDHPVELQKLLKKHGDTHTEKLFDPETGKWTEEPVATGYNYMFKLDHPVRKKFSARERDGYTMDETPTAGKGRGGQSFDFLTSLSLLGHNAHAILGESYGTKGVKNDEYWHAYQAGETPPPPKVPFVFDKFRAMLNVAGVKTDVKDNVMHYMPLTEKAVKAQSKGEITEASTLRARGSKALDVVEEKGGLFDTEITGGLKGENYAHITLPERIPHPLYEKVIRDITGLKTAEYYGLLAHSMKLDSKTGKIGETGDLTGEAAFKKILSFDVDEKLKDVREKLKTAVGSDTNKYNRSARYLKGLKSTGLNAAEAYLTNAVPVLPPKYRPIIEMSGGALRVADANLLYRDVIMAKNQVKSGLDTGVPAETLKDARLNTYKAVGALVGVNNALTHRDDREDARGAIDTIKGRQNKEGLFQRLLARRRNDYSGRSTIEPDAQLGPDEIGLPDDMAWKIFKPTVVRRMVLNGWTPADAMKEVESRTLAASQALDAEMKERPVLYNRAPSLHKWSVGAAFASRTPGKHIGISPSILGPTGGDADGNCCVGSTYLTLLYQEATSVEEIVDFYKVADPKGLLVLAVTPEGLVVRSRIDNVPYLPKTKKLDKNGASVYATLPGIKVLTADETGKGSRFADVTKVTVEDGCRLVKVETAGGLDVTVSDNESLAVYDHETQTLKRVKPEDAISCLSPVAAHLPLDLQQGTDRDFEVGWLIGAFVSDGYFMGAQHRVGFCKEEPEVREEFTRIMRSFGSEVSSTLSEENDSKLAHSVSVRFRCNSEVSSPILAKCYVDDDLQEGRAALRKVLPPMVLSSRKFAFGTISGMLDTDGTLTLSYSKDKPQVQAKFSTSSRFLRDSFVELLHALGVRSGYSTTKPSKGRLQTHESYSIWISTVDLGKIAGEIKLKTASKQQVLKKLIADLPTMHDNRDLVPLPASVITAVKQLWKDRSIPKPLYTTVLAALSKDSPAIRRSSATAIADLLEAKDIETDWVRMARDLAVRWDRISTVTEVPTERVYDLEVPENKVFAVNGGLIIYDTYSVIVPISEQAKQEAHGMLASRNLKYDKDRTLAYGLEKDVITGLFVLTKPGTDSGKTYDTEEEAIAAYRDPKQNLRMDNLVTIKGSPGKPAIGWLLFKQVVPTRFLSGISAPIDGKKLEKLLTTIAETSPGDFNLISKRIAQAGFSAAAASGKITSSIDELAMDKTKVFRLIDQLDKKVQEIKEKGLSTKQQNKELKTVHDMYVKDINAEVGKHLDEVGHGYSTMMEARMSGKINPDQFRQMLASPLLMTDVNDNTVPAVIKSNYGGGMNPSDYVLTTPGARKGMVGKSLSTALPGFLNKVISANMSPVRVLEKDCGTQRGLELPLQDSALKNYDVDLLDRHLLKDIPGTSFHRNDPITPQILSTLRDKGVKTVWVRSPLTCQAQQAPCQMCAGRDASGMLHPLGSNIGTNYGQTIAERSTQLTLRSFHSGGTLGSGDSLTQGFQRLQELLHAPDTIREQGTLADKAGRITRVYTAPQGGEYVEIDGHQQYVSAGRKVIVKVGDIVEVGDALSDGNFRPQELAMKKGMLHAQQYVVDEARKAYQQAGAVVRKPVLEVLVGGTMRFVKITDDGGEDEINIGDVITEQKFEKIVKRNNKVKGIPEVPGIGSKPLLSNDLMERLNFQRLEDAVREVPAMAGRSDLTGQTSPLPGLAYGVAFRPGQEAFNLKDI